MGLVFSSEVDTSDEFMHRTRLQQQRRGRYGLGTDPNRGIQTLERDRHHVTWDVMYPVRLLCALFWTCLLAACVSGVSGFTRDEFVLGASCLSYKKLLSHPPCDHTEC